MSARHHSNARAFAHIPPAARASARGGERDALAEALARHAPRGAVRIAEALAAVAMNRRRRRERLWNGALADAEPRFDSAFAGLAEQPISARADAAWNAICRRIAARALAGAGPDPTAGAICAARADAPQPAEAVRLAARLGDFAFYRGD
jgi:hypothetical protein